MNKFKPFVLGSLAGAGLMFGLLNYHIVQSHDGLQWVPRTPQPSLGLAYADIRQYDAQQWTDRPELARALVAHGSSDLISQSVLENVTRSVNEDGGTVDRLRSLLNDSRDSSTSETESSLFDLFERDERDGRLNDGGLAIPFPAESRAPSWEDELAKKSPTRLLDSFGDPIQESLDERWSRSNASAGSREPQGFNDRAPVWPPARTSYPPESPNRDPFADIDFDDPPAVSPGQLQREREIESLEQSLFGDDFTNRDPVNTPSGSEPTARNPGELSSAYTSSGSLDSVRRSLNSRAEQVLERARKGLRNEVADATSEMRSATDGYVRDRIGVPVPESGKPSTGLPPDASSGRATDDDTDWWGGTLDPFLD